MTKFYLNFICEEHGMMGASSVSVQIVTEYATKHYNDKSHIRAKCGRCGKICAVELYEVSE